MQPADRDLALIVDNPRNTRSLKDLFEALKHGGVIPFVGAGLSRPFGFPEWAAFLRGQAGEVGAEAEIEARLAGGEYEEAAEDLQRELGELAFEDAIRHCFGTDIRGREAHAAVRMLPALANGPVLTTNFDRVLETVFEEANKRFVDVVCGAEPGRVTRALHVNELLLWKLHGDFKSSRDRILTNSEYADHYGHSDPAQVDWQRPLPSLFDTLLGAHPVLFLGCSLMQDRIVRLLRAFSERHKGVGHYALVPDPGDDDRSRRRDLSNVGIRPIWFPPSRFDLIAPFIQFLAEQQTSPADQTSLATQRARIERGIEEQRQAFAVDSGQSAAAPQRVVGDRPQGPKRFRGRTTQLQEVGECLASPSTRLVTLVGPSGIGKTALALRLLADLEENRWPPSVAGRQVQGIAYLSTRTKGITFERLYRACVRMLGGTAGARLEREWNKEPPLGVEERIEILLDALAAPTSSDGESGGLYMILLDHLEDLLDRDGHISDDEIRTLMHCSLSRSEGPRLIVTSHIRPALSRDSAKVDEPIMLSEGLSTDDGIAMLRDLDRGSGLKSASDEALTRVVTHLHGVPRALEVFAGILENDDSETVDHLLDRFYASADAVDELFKEGINRLDDASQRVVEALAVFGQPAPAPAIDFLLQPFVPGLDLPAVLRRLSRGQTVRVADRVKGTWALHPIDQDFAYARCPEMGRYSRRALHLRAAEWHATVRPPREKWGTLEGLDPLLREFDHWVKAGLFNDAAAVLAEFDDEFRGRLGHAARSLAMHLQVQGRITVDRVRMLELLGLAHAYRHIGPLEQAIATYKEALAMARAQQNAEVEIESLGWMGETFRRLGRLDDGIVVVREAVATARRTGDRTRVARWLGELALNSCYRGALGEALRAAEEAYATAVDLGDLNWEALAIDALALVHLVRGNPEESIKKCERAIDMYSRGSWEHTVIYVLNVMGLAYLDLQQNDRAIECLRRAWEEARVCEDIRVEGMTRFNLAHACRIKRDIDTALEMAEDAVRCFTKSGGGELPAARALADGLRACAAGLKGAEARSLVAVARASMSNPDLRHPGGILEDAVRLAREAQQPDIGTEAERLRAELRARLERADDDK